MSDDKSHEGIIESKISDANDLFNMRNQESKKRIEALNEKLEDLEKQLHELSTSNEKNENIKELETKGKYLKKKIQEMEDREIVFSIRLAEAEKDFSNEKNEKSPEVVDDKNFNEKLDAKHFYMEKCENLQQQLTDASIQFTDLQKAIINLKNENERLSAHNHELKNKLGKTNYEQPDLDVQCMQIQEDNVKLHILLDTIETALHQYRDYEYHANISQIENCSVDKIQRLSESLVDDVINVATIKKEKSPVHDEPLTTSKADEPKLVDDVINVATIKKEKSPVHDKPLTTSKRDEPKKVDISVNKTAIKSKQHAVPTEPKKISPKPDEAKQDDKGLNTSTFTKEVSEKPLEISEKADKTENLKKVITDESHAIKSPVILDNITVESSSDDQLSPSTSTISLNTLESDKRELPVNKKAEEKQSLENLVDDYMQTKMKPILMEMINEILRKSNQK